MSGSPFAVPIRASRSAAPGSRSGRGQALVLAFLGAGLAGAAPAPPETRLGEALFRVVEIGKREVWAPREPGDAEARLAILAGEAGSGPETVLALARLRVLRGDEDGAREAVAAWAATHPDAAVGEGQAADFALSRGDVAGALAALDRAAARLAGEARAGILGRALRIVEENLPEGVDPVPYFRRRIEAVPGNEGYRRDLLDHLERRGGPAAAFAELESWWKEASARPASLRRRGAELLARMGRVEQAVRELRQAALAGTEDEGFDLLYAFLDGEGLLEVELDRLEEAHSGGGLDADDALVYFHLLRGRLYREDRASPARVLEVVLRWEEASRAGESPAGLRRVAAMCARIGARDQAFRRFYRAYLVAGAAGDAGERNASLLALLDYPDGDLAGSGDAATRGLRLDPVPGVAAGAASFLLSGMPAAHDLAGLGRLVASSQAGARRERWLAAGFPGAAPATRVALLLASASRYGARELLHQAAGLRLAAAAAGTEPARSRKLRIEAAEAVLGLRGHRKDASAAADADQAEAMLREALGEARAAGDEADRRRSFAALEAALRARADRSRVLALYREELEASPGDAQAYERFLSLLESYRMHDESAQVYRQAIERLDRNAWFSRAGSWYLRQKRKAELDELGRQAVKVLGADALADYLSSFVHWTHKKPGDRDSRLYLELGRAALARFPHEIRFADRLISYHRHFGEEEAASALEWRFGWREPRLFEGIMRTAMRTRSGAALESLLKAASSGGTDSEGVASVLLARWYEWLSRFEEAFELRTAAVAKVPGDEGNLESAARLARSLDRTEAAARHLGELGRRHPREARFPETLGEVLLEGDDPFGARDTWKRIATSVPGNEERSRRAATVLWDYYFHDEAIEVLTGFRSATGRSEAFAKELAYLHESRGDARGAAREYLRWIAEVDEWAGPPRERLAHLVSRGKLAEVDGEFEVAMAARPDHLRLLEIRLDMARRSGGGESRTEEVQLLEAAVVRAKRPGTLRWILAQAKRREARSLEGTAMTRLVDVSGRSTGSLLEALAWSETAGEARSRDALEAELAARAEALPVKKAGEARRIQKALADLRFRAKRIDEALAALARFRALGRPEEAREDARVLLARLAEAGRDDARKLLLQELAVKEPGDPEWVRELAAIRVRDRDVEAIKTLFAEARERVTARSDLGSGEKTSLLERLRLEAVRALDACGAYREATWELVEWIQDRLTDLDRARRSAGYARRRGTREILLGHFSRQAERASKDARFAMILAEFAAAEGDDPTVSARLAEALVQEPQRTDWRARRVDLLLRAGDLAAAGAELAILIRSTSEGPSPYLRDLAEVRRLEGDLPGAREALARLGETEPGSEAQALARLGLHREAADRLEAALDAVAEGKLPAGRLAHHDVSVLVDSSLIARGAGETWSRLRRLSERLATAARTRATREGEHLAERLAQAATNLLPARVRALGTAADQREMRQALGTAPALAAVENSWEMENLLRTAGYEELTRSYLQGERPGGGPVPPDWGRERGLAAHLESAGLDEALGSELERRMRGASPSERQDLSRQRAKLARRRGDRAEELRAYSPARGAFLGHPDQIRFVDLLLELEGKTSAVAELASENLWGVNEALRRGWAEEAVQLLDGRRIEASPRWYRDAVSRIGTRFRILPERTGQEYAALLDLRDLHAMVSAPTDGDEAERSPGFWAAADRYAGYLLGLGRTEAARRFAAAWVEGRPRDPTARLSSARTLANVGDVPAALRLIDGAGELRPGDAAIAADQIRTLHGIGRPEEARSRLEALVKPGGRRVDGRDLRWDLFARVGRELGEHALVSGELLEVLAESGTGLAFERTRELLGQWLRDPSGSQDRQGGVARLVVAWAKSGPLLELLARRREVLEALRIEAFEGAVRHAASGPPEIRWQYLNRLAGAYRVTGRKADLERLWPELEAAAKTRAAASGSDDPAWRIERARLAHAMGRRDAALGELEAWVEPEGEASRPPRLDRFRAAYALMVQLGEPERAEALRTRYFTRVAASGGGRALHARRALLAVRSKAGGDQAGSAAEARSLVRAAGDAEEALRILEAVRAGLPSQELVGLLTEAGRRFPDSVALELERGLVEVREAGLRESGWTRLGRLLAVPGLEARGRSRAMAAFAEVPPGAEDLARTAGSAFRAAGRDGEEAAEYLEIRAHAALGRGDRKEAVRLLGEAGKRHVLGVEALVLRARLESEAGNHQEAARDLAEVTRRTVHGGFPGPAEARRFHAEVRSGRPFAALARLQLPATLGSLRSRSPPADEDPLEVFLGSDPEPGNEGEAGDYEAPGEPGESYGTDGEEGAGDEGPSPEVSEGGEWSGLFEEASDHAPEGTGLVPPYETPTEIETLEAWLGGLPVGEFLRALVEAREAEGDLEGALGALDAWKRMVPGDDQAAWRTRIEAEAEAARRREEERLVLVDPN